METRMQRADPTAPTTPEQYRAAIDRQERVIKGLRDRLAKEESGAAKIPDMITEDVITDCIDAGRIDEEDVLLIWQRIRQHLLGPCRYHGNDYDGSCETYSGQVPCDPEGPQTEIERRVARSQDALDAPLRDTVRPYPGAKT